MDRGSLLFLVLAIVSSVVMQSVSPSAETPLDVEDYLVKWPSGAETPFSQEAYPSKWCIKGPDGHEAAEHVDVLRVKTGVLFLRKSLYPGALLPQGTKLGLEAMPMQFVSKRDAEAFPFSSTELERILAIFKIPPGSERAKQVAATIRICENGTGFGEAYTCATSQEAEADFVAQMLPGSISNLRRIVTTFHGTKQQEPAQYTVAAPNGISHIAGDALVVCHAMTYPYTVRYCHRPAERAEVDVLRVQLTDAGVVGGGGSAAATAVAVCHKDTTAWDSRFFDLLNAARGEEICHYMPQNYVLWM